MQLTEIVKIIFSSTSTICHKEATIVVVWDQTLKIEKKYLKPGLP